MFSTYFIAY